MSFESNFGAAQHQNAHEAHQMQQHINQHHHGADVPPYTPPPSFSSGLKTTIGDIMSLQKEQIREAVIRNNKAQAVTAAVITAAIGGALYYAHKRVSAMEEKAGR